MAREGPPNKRMQLTKLRAAPVLRAEVPPCAPVGRPDGGTASQLIRGVRRTSGGRGRGCCETTVEYLKDLRDDTLGGRVHGVADFRRGRGGPAIGKHRGDVCLTQGRYYPVGATASG